MLRNYLFDVCCENRNLADLESLKVCRCAHSIEKQYEAYLKFNPAGENLDCAVYKLHLHDLIRHLAVTK